MQSDYASKMLPPGLIAPIHGARILSRESTSVDGLRRMHWLAAFLLLGGLSSRLLLPILGLQDLLLHGALMQTVYAMWIFGLIGTWHLMGVGLGARGQQKFFSAGLQGTERLAELAFFLRSLLIWMLLSTVPALVLGATAGESSSGPGLKLAFKGSVLVIALCLSLAASAVGARHFLSKAARPALVALWLGPFALSFFIEELPNPVSAFGAAISRLLSASLELP